MGQEKLSKRAQITQEDVLEGLQREATTYGKGSSHSARVTAWIWIGKHLGMFTERAEVKGEARVQRHDFSHFGDDDLRTLDRLLRRASVTNR